MAEQTYALAKSGVFGMSSGVYQDSLTKIIEDWEDSDVAEYAGDTGSFAANTNAPVKNGSYSGKGSASSAVKSISSTTGLNAYPAQGDTWRTWTRWDTAGCNLGMYWATQSEAREPDGYLAQISDNAGSIRLYINNGGYTKLAASSVSVAASTWYQTEVKWASDGTITFTLFNESGSQLAQASATDTTFSSGGVGWRLDTSAAGISATSVYDYARVI